MHEGPRSCLRTDRGRQRRGLSAQLPRDRVCWALSLIPGRSPEDQAGSPSGSRLDPGRSPPALHTSALRGSPRCTPPPLLRGSRLVPLCPPRATPSPPPAPPPAPELSSRHLSSASEVGVEWIGSSLAFLSTLMGPALRINSRRTKVMTISLKAGFSASGPTDTLGWTTLLRARPVYHGELSGVFGLNRPPQGPVAPHPLPS